MQISKFSCKKHAPKASEETQVWIIFDLAASKTRSTRLELIACLNFSKAATCSNNYRPSASFLKSCHSFSVWLEKWDRILKNRRKYIKIFKEFFVLWSRHFKSSFILNSLNATRGYFYTHLFDTRLSVLKLARFLWALSLLTVRYHARHHLCHQQYCHQTQLAHWMLPNICTILLWNMSGGQLIPKPKEFTR